jgi:hypothetical protein
MGKIPLGRVVATPGALKMLEESGEDSLYHLARHASGTGVISTTTTTRKMS